ncbi:hypothetical protein ACNKHT_23395 [Shigella flexneri]
MFKVHVNAAKAEAMGVALSDINQTTSHRLRQQLRDRLPQPGG